MACGRRHRPEIPPSHGGTHDETAGIGRGLVQRRRRCGHQRAGVSASEAPSWKAASGRDEAPKNGGAAALPAALAPTVASASAVAAQPSAAAFASPTADASVTAALLAADGDADSDEVGPCVALGRRHRPVPLYSGGCHAGFDGRAVKGASPAETAGGTSVGAAELESGRSPGEAWPGRAAARVAGGDADGGACEGAAEVTSKGANGGAKGVVDKRTDESTDGDAD